MKNKKKRTILIKIFSVNIIFTVSLIMFILGISGIMVKRPNPFYAHIHFVLTLIILLCVGLMIIHYLIKKILKPLTELNEAVEKAGKGNFDQKIEIRSNDELGTLASTFNQMTSEIKNMITAREQLLIDVSHELRSPITRARLALEMMPDSSEKKSIEGDLREMETMITGILESERLASGAIKPDFKRVKISEFLKRFHEKYNIENERLVLIPIKDKLQITIDENLIMTVVRNLIDNALKYTKDKPIEISVSEEEDFIKINIEDNGPGIPEDKLAFVFEPFYRTDQSRSRKTGGYGLGLHLCKRIMDLHKADITLKNKKKGTGITATLTFPKNFSFIEN